MNSLFWFNTFFALTQSPIRLFRTVHCFRNIPFSIRYFIVASFHHFSVFTSCFEVLVLRLTSRYDCVSSDHVMNVLMVRFRVVAFVREHQTYTGWAVLLDLTEGPHKILVIVVRATSYAHSQYSMIGHIDQERDLEILLDQMSGSGTARSSLLSGLDHDSIIVTGIRERVSCQVERCGSRIFVLIEARYQYKVVEIWLWTSSRELLKSCEMRYTGYAQNRP